jgi:hypothetical protein
VSTREEHLQAESLGALDSHGDQPHAIADVRTIIMSWSGISRAGAASAPRYLQLARADDEDVTDGLCASNHPTHSSYEAGRFHMATLSSPPGR